MNYQNYLTIVHNLTFYLHLPHNIHHRCHQHMFHCHNLYFHLVLLPSIFWYNFQNWKHNYYFIITFHILKPFFLDLCHCIPLEFHILFLQEFQKSLFQLIFDLLSNQFQFDLCHPKLQKMWLLILAFLSIFHFFFSLN